ncbi:SICAvar, type I [Plasmodium knowlesi strain H]|uniref:SICAvar, type I n=1 Tax=Plasmodium knowlesi (strain H) TaxID=5851 RepID=A0A679L8A4_PLAKH|nr:SICAvar, type I [Plasmodium knowlesi strain H]CAA9991235.1 SICAvar, type I [Plasmodium knowlesi strain H]VVS80709.1 SICAvar, type I [Plasmodium knowlesi strain H]
MTSASAGLLEEWMKKVAQTTLGPNGSAGTTITGGQIMTELKNDLEKAWEKLQASLTQAEAKEMTTLCGADVAQFVERKFGGGKNLGRNEHVKDLCKAVVELRYFTAGGGTIVNRGLNFDTGIKEHEWYPRCIVGAVALSAIYGDHCHLKDVIDHISRNVENKLQGHPQARANLNMCKDIKTEHLIFGRALLHKRIKEWAQGKRNDAMSGDDHKYEASGYRVGKLWRDKWQKVCKKTGGNQDEEQAKKEYLKENADSLASLVKVGPPDAVSNSTPGEPTMGQVLTNDSYMMPEEKLTEALQALVDNSTGGVTVDSSKLSTLMQTLETFSKETKAVACIQNYKNQDDKMCDRLQCIVNYLKTRDEATPAASPSPTENFWKDSGGEVANLWKELADKMKENKGTGESECDGMQNPSDKAACNYLHAGFTELYNPAAGTSSSATSPTGGTILSKDNPSFRQTMGCFLLHAYAKHMKEKATCLIDDGIQKAFQLGEKMSESNTNCTGNGKTCIPCKWKENDKEWEDCPITASGGNASGGTVKDKLGTIIDKDNDPHIKEMAKQVNKVDSLCDQFKCVANRWIKQDGNSRNWSDVWDEVTDQLKDLSGKIEEKKKDKEVYKHCSTLNDKTGKEACLLMAAGLKDLYDIRDNDNADGKDDLVEASFQRTMYCALLNAIADRLLTLPCKDEKSVQAGINEAFNRKNDEIMQGSKGCKTDNASCFKCDRFNDYRTCEFKENDSNQVLLHTKIDSKLNEYDSTTATSTSTGSTTTTTTTTTSPLSKKSLITTIYSLCDQFKCVANRWIKQDGNSRNWSDVWDEVTDQLKDLSGKIEEKKKDKEVYKHCSTLNDKTGKEACLLMAAGLKDLYDIRDNDNADGKDDLVEASFQRTMYCALLNAIADRLLTLPCKDEKSVQAGINEAFNRKNDEIMQGSKGCKTDNASCFKCDRFNDYRTCEFKENDSNQVLLHTKIDSKLNEYDSTTATSTSTGSTTTTTTTTTSPLSKKSLITTIWMSKKNDDLTLNQYCKDVGSKSNDTPGEITAKQKACKLFASGLKHISDIKSDNNQAHDVPLRKTMMCAALNLYADQLTNEAKNQCPLDNEKLNDAIQHAFDNSTTIMNGGTSCSAGSGTSSCFICERQKTFPPCKIGSDEIKKKMTDLLDNEDKSNTASNNNQEKTLEKINEIETFCTQVQCAIKQHYRAKNGRTIANGKTPSWENIKSDATKELTALLKDMNDPTKQSAAEQYCSDKDAKWDALGHKKSKTNKAACLLFAAGLKHIYTYGNDQKKGPSFEQTMGCLFLKEYAKQLEKMANKKKKGNSWVHPYCDIDKGIKHAFGKSEKIMEETSQCKKNGNNSCFVCIQNQGYDDCNIGTDSVKDNVGTIFQDDQKQKHMQQTLENTVCPILLTDLLTPFLPLAPVSIGLSAMAYYLWKYFGPLGKEGARFRRSPVEIPGPSVQEQVLDHVEEAGPHEYRLVKERKPRSAPTRTKRSGPVNRRTIIEIHFEVLDECQKGDTQLNQKDFLELLVQEFMGSELMEEEQVPKEDVLMEAVPMERVPNLGSGFMV